MKFNCRNKKGTQGKRFKNKPCPPDHVMYGTCCVPCLKCSPGYERADKCTEPCTPCPQSPLTTFSTDGVKCKPCKDCETLGLTTIRNCTPINNSVCGTKCRESNHYYDPSLYSCRPSANVLRQLTTTEATTTTILPQVFTDCSPDQLSNTDNGCITRSPQSAALFPLLGAGGMALLLCALVILVIMAAVGLLYWYLETKNRRTTSSTNNSVHTHNRGTHVHSEENDYAEISESGSSNTVRTYQGQTTPEEMRRLGDTV